MYDPFAGVESTLVAALKNGRVALGSEYFDIGHDRIRRLSEGSLTTRPIYRAIYEPSPDDRIAMKPEGWK